MLDTQNKQKIKKINCAFISDLLSILTSTLSSHDEYEQNFILAFQFITYNVKWTKYNYIYVES